MVLKAQFFGLKMGGVEKMHLMMVSTTIFFEKMSYPSTANFSTLAKVDMAKNYHLQICITKLPSYS